MTKTLTKFSTKSKNNVSTRETKKSYNYNHNTAKYLQLADWVKENLVSSPGNYVTTKSLFEHYKLLTEKKALVTENVFSKQLESIMFALMFYPGRVKTRQGRGYQGIAFRKLTIGGFG